MKRAMSLLLIALCAASARTSLGSQDPAKTEPSSQTERNSARQNREGAITGRVVGPDGQPMAGARVVAIRFSERSGSQHSAIVADDGNFKLAGLSPGIYILQAHAPGYVSAETLAERTIHRIGENVTIGLFKGGVITGRVTDEAGEPIVDVGVKLHRLRNPEGGTTGSRFDMFDYGLGTTDDRGIYRVYGLRPGVYTVSVDSNDGAQIRRDAPTYYPSATRDTAAEINLRGGEEVSGVDIRHRGDRGHIISGSVSGDFEPPSYSSVYVTLRGFDDERFEANTSTSNTRGFAFYGVPDGAYELVATRGSDDGATSSSASRRVPVKGVDVSGVELKLAPRGSIAGRVVIESSTPPKKCAIKDDPVENQTSSQIQEQTVRRPVVEEIMLIADRDDPDQRPQMSLFGRRGGQVVPPKERGEFALKNLDAGRYRITAELPDDGWRIRAITQSSQSGAGSAKPASGAETAKKTVDASRDGVTIKPGEKISGVEVIIAEDAATLNGRVVSAKDGAKLPSSLRAHLIPADADDVIRYAETDVRGDGSFEFKHIAPGKYLLIARQASEKEVNDDRTRQLAWDAIERAKLRREAAAAKNEIELKPCQRMKEHILRWQP
jgi:protocatechuate 3,4-dioxygenase beta subunit